MESRITNHESRGHWGERGSVLVTILILIIVLTVIGAALVAASMTEITIAFNQGDAIASTQQAEAGVARSAEELGADATWAGTAGPVTLGDGTYDVTVASSGTMRAVTSTGIRSGGRQQIRAALKVVPRPASYAVLANTTATIGSATPGLTVSNTLQSVDAGGVHANNLLGAGTAITVNTAGATVIGTLTANGQISGVSCLSWPWRCDPSFGTLPLPRLDVDSGAGSSLRSRAIATIDPADGRNLYFRGGDSSSRCTSGGGYSFGRGQTQRCWDKYVHDRGGALGTGLTNPVYYIEPRSGEPTSYIRPTLTPAHRGSTGANNGGGSGSLTISRPGAVVANDVMIAAVNVRGGTGTAITAPANWSLVNRIDNGTTLSMAVYVKVAGAGEPGSYTWLLSPSAKAAGGINAFSDVDTLSPIDDAAGQTTPSGTLHSTPSITTTSANSRLVATFAIARGTTWSAPGGMTERYDQAATGGSPFSRVTAEGAEQLQAAAGSTGSRTATSADGGAVGVAHLLALRPGGLRVDCVGYASATVTLCARSQAATASDSSVEFANSRLDEVTGSVVMFRRDSATAVFGDIVFENVSARTVDYVHRSLDGDPAFVAGGRLQVISSGNPGPLRTVEIAGIVYTFAGADNPDGNNNLQGSAANGIDVQHGANQVSLAFHGVLMSNGNVTVQDTANNAGTVAVHYDAAVANTLPGAFGAITTNNVVVPVSWSSGD